jgi:hypothetical protein
VIAAALVNATENDTVGVFDDHSAIELPAIDVDEDGIVAEGRRKAGGIGRMTG